MLYLTNKKESTYPFSQVGFKQLYIDKQKSKMNNISNIIFYSIIIVLLIKGVIGIKFLINYIVCTGTSTFVKCLMR